VDEFDGRAARGVVFDIIVSGGLVGVACGRGARGSRSERGR
jgi:hypothetical protein